MKTLKLQKSKLDFFAAVLQQFGEVHAPVARGGGYAFERLERWSDARLDRFGAARSFPPETSATMPPGSI